MGSVALPENGRLLWSGAVGATPYVVRRIMPINQMIHGGWEAPFYLRRNRSQARWLCLISGHAFHVLRDASGQ